VSLELDEHRIYLSDRNRLRAFSDALREVVRPDDVVLDLGSGTGILGMLACQAGAARVYGVDHGPMAGVARSIVHANRFHDRMTIVRGHSTQVSLPEPVSLVVTDQIGNFGFNAGLFEFMADARARLLAPGGRCIPAWVELWTAPAEHPAIREQVRFWSERPAGLDYSPAGTVAQSSGYPCEIDAAALLAAPAATIHVEPPSATDALSGTVSRTVTRDGVLDGVAGWFVAGLSPSVTMTNAPGDPARINRRPVLLPLAAPRTVKRGDAIEIRLRLIAPLSVVEWRVTVTPAEGRTWVERGSTFPGLLMSREDLEHSRPDWKPELTSLGEARRTVLELCDGRTLKEIEQEILKRHPDVVPTPEAAAVFVAEVVTRYAR
jgi:protein arginine N-methyltransferase 1